MKKKNLLMTTIAIFGLATISMAQVPSYVPTNGLVGWWPFNGNANDESVNGNNGTVNGPTLTTDRFGNANSAFSFTNNSISVLNSNFAAFGSNSFSCSVWAKYTNPGNSLGNFVRYGNGVNGDGWGMRYTGDSKINSLEYSVTNNNITSSLAYNDNNWHNIIFVKDVNNLSVILYIDGVLINTVSMMSSYINDISIGLPFNIGTANGYENFIGSLDDIGIWNRALTQCEIQVLYDVQLGSQSISAGIDQTLCSGDSIALSASGGINYQWSNNVLDSQAFAPTQSNVYVVNGTNALGCQGSDTVMITVLENATSTLNETALDSYTLNGQTYTESGTYSQTIPSANGCDSVITLNLTLNFTGLSQEETTLFVLYPNPASEQITIKTDEGMIGKEYALYDQVGKLITKGKITGLNTSLFLQGLARGLYSIALQGQEKKSFTISKE
jgi:hypothetical protein